jgi:hypothetical protein
MRRAVLLASLVAVSLVFGDAAAAGVVHVGWNERAKVGGKPAIGFRVESFVTRTSGGNHAWAVVGSITNRTSKPLRVSDQFGLVLFRDAATIDPREGKLMPALAFSPPVPKVLAPGKTWRGSFGGAGTLPKGAYVRVLFGWFSGPALEGKHGFNWLTDHVQRWRSRSVPIA